MLAMQAKPIQPEQPGTAEPEADAQATQQQQQQLAPQRQSSQPAASVLAAAARATGQPDASTTAAAAAKPLVLLLDVHLDAPVLLLPLNSASEDRLEVDLGTLTLANRVLWEMRTEQDSQKLLVDEMQVGLRRGSVAGVVG